MHMKENEMKVLSPHEELFLETLKDNHKGKENAITSTRLRHFGTSVQIRRMVHQFRVLGYPICSCLDGYYYAESSQELKETMNFLRSYLDKIEDAYNGIRESYYEMKHQEIIDRNARDD